MDGRPIEDPLIGRLIDDRYEIEQRVGGWSMGSVYRASHVVLERPVELYVLRREFSEDRKLVEEFMASARAASKLDHPAILGVFDSGWIDDESFFFVSEHVVADTFRALIAEHGKLPWRRVRGLAIQLADALGAFHQQGVVHCAIEPANILVGRQDDQDVVKVRNFGTHKIIEAFRHSPPIFSGDSGVFGAPEYMAPEQAQGLPGGPRTDVYSAAACIYELLTGQPPIEGKNFQQIISRILTRTPAPASEVAPENVPGAVDELLRKALSRIPDSRYPSMAEFGAAILALPPSLQPKKPSAGAPSKTVEDNETPVVTPEGDGENLARKTLVAIGPAPAPAAPEAPAKNPLRQTLVAPETEQSGNNLRRTQIAPHGQFMGFSVPSPPPKSSKSQSAPRRLAQPVIATSPPVEPPPEAPKSRTPLIVVGVLAIGLLGAFAIITLGTSSDPEPTAPGNASATPTAAESTPQPTNPQVAAPEDMTPEPSIDPANLPEALTAPEIQQGFKSAEEQVATDCGRHPGTKVEIIATISGAGTVVSAKPAKGQESALATCVTEAVTNAAKFAPFAKSSDTFRWTFRL